MAIGIWALMPSDTIHEGDRGYRQMMRDRKLVEVLLAVCNQLPRPLRVPLAYVMDSANRRFKRQYNSLMRTEYVSGFAINGARSTTNQPKPLSADEIMARVSQAVTDKRYKPFVFYAPPQGVPGPTLLFCRTKDLPALKEAFRTNIIQQFQLGPLP